MQEEKLLGDHFLVCFLSVLVNRLCNTNWKPICLVKFA